MAQKHAGAFRVLHGAATSVWHWKCGRHAEGIGETYEAAEDDWRRHVHAETGTAPKARGSKTDRWQPTDSEVE